MSTFFSSQMQTPVPYAIYLLSLYTTQMEEKRSVWAANKPEEAEFVILTTDRM